MTEDQPEASEPENWLSKVASIVPTLAADDILVLNEFEGVQVSPGNEVDLNAERLLSGVYDVE